MIRPRPTHSVALIVIAMLPVAVALGLAACDDGETDSAGGLGAPDASSRPPPDAATGSDATHSAADAQSDAGLTDARLADAGLSDARLADAGLDVSPPGAQCADAETRNVAFDTTDGVTLAADFHPAAGGRAAVLLHMIPPSNTRRNYPPEFIDALVERGFSVLNVDRRGAGDSGGIAREAYEGPAGKLDARAAVGFLLDSECGIGAESIAIVGASNGTTTAFDYAASDAPEDTPPAALVFLTGGNYTENQTDLTVERDRLAQTPILFAFSTQERAWSAGFIPSAPDAWRFEEFDPGDHGTRMFGSRPESIDAVADWLDEVVNHASNEGRGP